MFDLASIRKGKAFQAPRILLYGVHGIGKSTFGANAPNPIFIQTEDGLGTIDTSSFPLATTSAAVISAVDTLLTSDHEYQTVVLDSIDWFEAILIREIEHEFDEKALAYGKGTNILVDRMATFLEKLNLLRNTKGMTVILLAHAQVKRFDSPETEPYDRYMPKLKEAASAKVQEWADAVLFTNYKTLIKKDDVGFNKSQSRGVSTGERLIHTQETAAFKAKNRYSLPPSLPLTWNAFQNAVAASAA
ncbi:MAG: ATP-binding protein [Telluria sp.]